MEIIWVPPGRGSPQVAFRHGAMPSQAPQEAAEASPHVLPSCPHLWGALCCDHAPAMAGAAPLTGRDGSALLGVASLSRGPGGCLRRGLRCSTCSVKKKTCPQVSVQSPCPFSMPLPLRDRLLSSSSFQMYPHKKIQGQQVWPRCAG